MLIEVKVKVARIIDGKTRKRTETFIIDKCDYFAQAEYNVSEVLEKEQTNSLIKTFEIQSLRISPIKEFYPTDGDYAFVATLKDTFIDDDGNEKPLKYKILIWADNLTEAHQKTVKIVEQGYDMHIESIKEADYRYLP